MRNISQSTSPELWNNQSRTGEWAVSLQRTLVVNSFNSRQMHDRIDFWLDSIKHFYDKKSPETSMSIEWQNIAMWYLRESKAHSYQARNWKIDPKYLALFQEFRSDEFYHLKNLVEVVLREIVELKLMAEGFREVQVYRTSDHDDVTAWADLIAKVRRPDGSRYTFAIDLAVSGSEKYLSKKLERSQTKCREYNRYTDHHVDTLMDREVIAIRPEVMWHALIQYLWAVGSWKMLSSAQKLQLLEWPRSNSIASIRGSTSSRTQSLLTHSIH